MKRDKEGEKSYENQKFIYSIIRSFYFIRL